MYYRQLFEYNKKIVAEIFDIVQLSSFNKVVEFGSGSGLFTLPLMNRLYDMVEEYIIVDPFPGPYAKDKEMLLKRLKDAGFQDKVSIFERPVWNIHRDLSDVDLIIGHDVFCDLSMTQVKDSLRSGKKTMKNDGTFIHSGLSPTATSRSERLLIKLDSLSSNPVIGGNWFSPGSEFLYAAAREIGFKNIDVHEVKVPITLEGKDAWSLIDEWNIRKKALMKYADEINKIGLEFPKEQVLVCKKR
jgi:hypothetical protein